MTAPEALRPYGVITKIFALLSEPGWSGTRTIQAHVVQCFQQAGPSRPSCVPRPGGCLLSEPTPTFRAYVCQGEAAPRPLRANVFRYFEQGSPSRPSCVPRPGVCHPEPTSLRLPVFGAGESIQAVPRATARGMPTPRAYACLPSLRLPG